jgi:molybdopterin converting factor small subunit
MDQTINIKLFGSLVDLLKQDVIQLNIVQDVNSLKEQLFLHYPILKEKAFAIAVNQKIIHENIAIIPNTEIALLPPFSGG